MKMTTAELEAFLDTEFPQMRPMQMRIGRWDGTTMRLTMPMLKLGKALAVVEIGLTSAGVEGPVAHSVQTYSIPPARP